jgi:hypothetical protein
VDRASRRLYTAQWAAHRRHADARRHIDGSLSLDAWRARVLAQPRLRPPPAGSGDGDGDGDGSGDDDGDGDDGNGGIAGGSNGGGRGSAGAGVRLVDAALVLPDAAAAAAAIVAVQADPRELARCVAAVADPASSQALLETVFFGLYGAHLPLPGEGGEWAALRFLGALLDLHTRNYRGDPAGLLRGPSPFARAVSAFAHEAAVQGNNFLVHGLRETVLMLLTDEKLDLEVDPVLVWKGLPEDKRVACFGPQHAQVNWSAVVATRMRKKVSSTDPTTLY